MHKRNTKPKSSAWNYFKRVKESDDKDENLSLVKYQCIYCDARYAGHATRLTKHLGRGCRKCPKSISSEFTNLLKYRILDKSESNKSYDSKCDSSVSIVNEDTSYVDFNQSSNSNGVHSKIEPKSLNKIEKLYARAFYSAGLSLNFTENEYWQEFLHLLEPSFKVPSKSRLAQHLLQRECDFIEEKIRQKAEETPILGLQITVLENKKGQLEVNFFLNVPQSLFYKTTTLQSKNDISYHLENEIISIMEQFGHKKFLIIMTQDVSVLDATSVLSEDKPNIVRFFCSAHSFNLFLENIFNLQIASTLLASSKIIAEEFKNISGASVCLQIPVMNNWKSVFKCFEALLESENYLKEVGISEQTFSLSSEVRSLLIDEHYWSKLKKLYFFVEPIFKWMKEISNNVCISHVVNYFHELMVHVESLTKLGLFKVNEVKKLKEFLTQKREMTITPLHLAANILDPKFNGNYLTYNEQIEGSEYVDKISHVFYENDTDSVKEVMCEMAKYRCHEGIFKVPYVLKTASHLAPDIWWKGSCYGLKLSRVANFILSLPATTASTERLIYIDANYIAKKNELTEEQKNKYIFAFKNLKLMHTDYNTIDNTIEELSSAEDSKVMQLMSEDDITEIEYEVYDESN